jgi:hypothetical protein
MYNPTLFHDISNMPVIAWWSGGITSAVACKKALELFDNVLICYIETGSHHDDTQRFKADCERWYGKEILTFQSSTFKNHIDVILTEKYVNGPDGAKCTMELKKQVRYSVELIHGYKYQVWGFDFTKKEINRAIRFLQQNPFTKPVFPLIEFKLTKNECAGIITSANIELPVMYQLGYSNNNCIGCVKGGKGYWNKIRVDFPKWFAEMAMAERIVGASCINGVFLDELKPTAGRDEQPVVPECGAMCQSKYEDIEDKMTPLVMEGKVSLLAYLNQLKLSA